MSNIKELTVKDVKEYLADKDDNANIIILITKDDYYDLSQATCIWKAINGDIIIGDCKDDD